MISEAEKFWLVGLLEGEANFNYIKTQSIYVAMTDEDIIYKVADLFTRIGNRRRQKIWQCLNKFRGPTRKYTYKDTSADTANIVHITRRV